jgi:hypothetical protein
MLKPLAITLTGAATLSVVLSLIAADNGWRYVPHMRKKMSIAGTDARMRNCREQELRARQEKFPLRDLSRRGNAY